MIKRSAFTCFCMRAGKEIRMKTITCCDEELCCTKFTNTCPHCGTDYNSAGQQLAPRDQWGEETGESAEDILRIDSMSIDECFDVE